MDRSVVTTRYTIPFKKSTRRILKHFVTLLLHISQAERQRHAIGMVVHVYNTYGPTVLNKVLRICLISPRPHMCIILYYNFCASRGTFVPSNLAISTCMHTCAL